jgi:murein DD-endopeptidase MepM/ murein hydrolase activator NlpD
VIDHLNGEYSLIAHMKQGSVKVRLGEKIKQGQLVGQIGISGDADYVHTHYQLQNGFDLNAEALPSYFRDFRWMLGSTSRKVERGQMNSGDIVESYAIR